MKFPKYVRSLVLLSLMGLPTISANAAGIPVIDSASIAERALQHAESLAKYLEQIGTLKAQLQRAERQYEALTGTRNLGEILNNPHIRASLPPDLREVLRGNSTDLASIQDRIERIQNEEVLTGDYTIDAPAMEQRTEELAQRSKALLEQAQAGTEARLEQLDELQAQINQTTDPMAIAELQARLQIEQANIQADQMRADLLSRQIEAEKMLIESQAAKMASQTSMSIGALRAPLP